MAGKYDRYSEQSVTNFITLYKSSALDFKKLLADHLIRCKDEALIPRIFIDIRGMFINVHDKLGRELCRDFLNKEIPAYSREIIMVVNNWCKIMLQEGFTPVIIPFGEYGDSSYHRKLNEKYKDHRYEKSMLECGEELLDASRTYTTDELKNINWIFSTPGTNICSIISENLEFDAAVHLIKTRIPEHKFESPYGTSYTRKYFNIILSKDKDFAQCLDENTIQIIKKSKGEYRLIDESNSPVELMKMKPHHTVSAKYMNLALAMIGDASDGYPGIKGCGEVLTGDFLTKFGSVLDKIPAKNNFKKFKSFMKYDFDDKDFNKVKKLYLQSKRQFFKSYCLADFATLCDLEKHREMMQKHIDKYKRVIFMENVNSDGDLDAKRAFLERSFKNRYQMLSESSYYHIIVNTEN
jgi:5'-3' exonuclease